MSAMWLCSAIVEVIKALKRLGLCAACRGIVEPNLHLQNLQVIAQDLDGELVEEDNSVKILVGRRSDEMEC